MSVYRSFKGKKKSSATWLETDLDLLITQDVGVENQVTNRQSRQQPANSASSRSTTPMYINTESKKGQSVSQRNFINIFNNNCDNKNKTKKKKNYVCPQMPPPSKKEV